MYVFLLSVVLPVLVSSAERNSSCTTPNGENGSCIPFLSCDVIKNAVFEFNTTAIEFAKTSQCGYDAEPLVCCGTSAFPISTIKPPENKFLPKSNECGVQLFGDRIFGGTITEIGEFPWMVLLRYNKSDGSDDGFHCGGTLINNRYVLTAAHCIKTESTGLILDSVRLGEWKISTDDDCHEDLINRECADPVINLKIEKLISHSNYSRRTGDNDIGLIRIERNVNFTDYVRPICLPSYYSPVPKDGSKMTAAGWGATEHGLRSDVKLKVEVPIISKDECVVKIKSRGKVDDNQICAGGEVGKDTCRGDSGGPLMTILNTLDDKPQWYQEGVIAWGIGCGSKNVPAVYTRIAKYINWILTSMEEF